MATARVILALSFIAILLAACSTAQTQYSSASEFSELHTFAWQQPAHEKPADPIFDSPQFSKLVADAAIATLSSRGYKLADSQQADFLITVSAERKTKETNDSVDPKMGLGLHGGGNNMQLKMLNQVSSRTQADAFGMVTMLIKNATTGQVIWRGWRKQPLDRKHFSRKGITKTVSRILADFPPKGR